jgi:hypothetical protein
MRITNFGEGQLFFVGGAPRSGTYIDGGDIQVKATFLPSCFSRRLIRREVTQPRGATALNA